MSLSKARLIRLEVQNFRGIGHRLALELSSPSQGRPGWVLLVGENGTGKSSFVDALEYLVQGELGHLKRRDVKESVSLRFRPDTKSDLETIVRALWRVPEHPEPLEWLTFYPHAESPDVPDALQDIALQCQERPFILRRAQILDFVNAKGAERQGKIVELLGLHEWEPIEKAWRQVQNDARKKAKDAETKTNDLDARITSQREKTEGALQALGQSLEEDTPQALIERLYERKAQVRRAMEQQADALEKRLTRLDKLHTQMQALLDAFQEWLPKVRSFQQEAQTEGQALLMRLLANGAQLLEETRPSTCPLCGQPIEHDAVLQYVQQRYAELSKLKSQREKLEQERQTLVRQTAAAQSYCQTLKVEESEWALQEVEGIEEALSTLSELLQKEVFRIATKEVASLLGSVEKMLADLEEYQHKLKQQLDEARKQLGDAPRSEQLVQAIEALKGLLSLQEQLGRAQAEKAQWAERAKLAGKVLKAFQESRQAFLEELFTQMEARFNEYWEALHPDEGIRFRLRTLSKGVGLDAEMQVGDTKKEGHPLTFLSEGHLDTLGLTIFLAFSQEFNSDLPFLVLDDVLTTVDHGHRQRVARLLAEKFADWHVILTTHDRLWGEQLRATAQAYSIPVSFYRMRPWDPISGASFEPWRQDPWKYYSEIAEKMPALAIAGAGRELEKFLNTMRRMLRIAVPANFSDQYTIGELWDGFKSWVKKYWPEDIPEEWKEKVLSNEALLQTLQEVERQWRMRNWSGAHYNEWADSVTVDEAKEFIEVIEQLVNRFRCPHENEKGQKCSAFLKHDPNLKAIMCSKRGPAHFQILSRG